MGESAYVNNPLAVMSAIKSRLELATNQWFLDTREGTPYKEQILGKHKSDIYNQAIQDRIKKTKGVKKILNYHSEYDPITRKVTITALIETIYGISELKTNI